MLARALTGNISGEVTNPLGNILREAMRHLVQISVELKESLDQYARLHSQLGGRSVDAATLIPHMLQAFINRDRGFRAMRKAQQGPLGA